jgi:hypothetical protein
VRQAVANGAPCLSSLTIRAWRAPVSIVGRAMSASCNRARETEKTWRHAKPAIAGADPTAATDEAREATGPERPVYVAGV